MLKRAIAIISGGMDSAVSASIAQQDGYQLVGVHFNYGQRTQTKELECFENICDDLGIENRYVIDLPFFADIGASALTDSSIEVPTAGLTPGVPITYVPFRNGIFLSIASAIAEKEGAEAIYIGVVEEDSSGYPDCREDFMKKMEVAINSGTKDDTLIVIERPLIKMSKADIVQKAQELGVNLAHTWSCYKDETKACGVCDSCRLRLSGFERAGLKDPIEYQI